MLAELQGVAIEGAESFAAAQQLVKSAAMGEVVSWVFQAHAEEEVSALLEEEEEEEPVLDLVRHLHVTTISSSELYFACCRGHIVCGGSSLAPLKRQAQYCG